MAGDRVDLVHACPLKPNCTTSMHGRILTRSFDESSLDRVRTYYATQAYQKAMRKRSVWVEPLFAEGKDWHGMRRFRLRLWRVNCKALMRAAGQNLKRLLKKWGWGRRPWPEGAANAAFSLLFLFLLLLDWPLETSFWVDLGTDDRKSRGRLAHR